jgi:hypothetical protein
LGEVSTPVSAHGLGIDGVKTAAGGHEEAVSARAAEADVGADFWENNLADSLSFRGEDVDAVVAFAHPAHSGPDVSVFVAANAIR